MLHVLYIDEREAFYAMIMLIGCLLAINLPNIAYLVEKHCVRR